MILEYKSNSLNSLLKVQVVLNENIKIPVSGDTSFVIEETVNTIRVKSFLDLKGILLRFVPLVDTLYSGL